MESDRRYYARRALEEYRAAERAVTPEAQARRRALAELFASKAQNDVGDLPAPARAEWPVHA